MKDASVLSDELLSTAIEIDATDIHFHPNGHDVGIYVRLLGKRTWYQSISLTDYQFLLTYFKFTSGMDIGENNKPQNGSMSHQVATSRYALRLSTLPVKQTESLAIRILPQENEYSINELFLFPNQLNSIKEWFTNKTGIILFTGPTGSGKTTTMYTLLETFIRQKSFQTITLEDPIEKNIDHILQVQINERAGITYQAGLKAALRHDPDIILVGEIRDKETAEFAFKASLTGHLVLSTLHAKDARGTIHRLLEMGTPKTDLLQSLIAICSLQLIPIQTNNHIYRRAAIGELLEGNQLKQQIIKDDVDYLHTTQTFDYLRKKAYAYGFISQHVLFDA